MTTYTLLMLNTDDIKRPAGVPDASWKAFQSALNKILTCDAPMPADSLEATIHMIVKDIRNGHTTRTQFIEHMEGLTESLVEPEPELIPS